MCSMIGVRSSFTLFELLAPSAHRHDIRERRKDNLLLITALSETLLALTPASMLGKGSNLLQQQTDYKLNVMFRPKMKGSVGTKKLKLD